MTKGGSEHAHHWTLDPELTYLNHGSFGACPRVVLEAQSELRSRLERSPVQFMLNAFEGHFARAVEALGALVGADPMDLAFVPNATTAVNTVLRSLPLAAGDEIVVTNHGYAACKNAVDFVASRRGAHVVAVKLPFRGVTRDLVYEAVVGAVTDRTRFVLIDHFTSPTGLRLPVERIVEHLNARNVTCMVDGAHGVGLVDLDLDALGAAYYTSNCHKWLCTPKGAAFLHVRSDAQEALRPLVIGHNATTPRTDRPRFQLEHAWTGTHDPTAFMVIPEAIAFLESLVAGGLPGLMARNRELALAVRNMGCEAFELTPPAPDDMIASMVAFDLPAENPFALARELFEAGFEVPVSPWPGPTQSVLRLSVHAYNAVAQYEQLFSYWGARTVAR